MPNTTFRFGIGEWYGKSFSSLETETRLQFADIQLSRDRVAPSCPFLSREGVRRDCWKKGGVCSLRLYERAADGTTLPHPQRGGLRATCPSRFEQSGEIYRWIGSVLLQGREVVPTGQINFLERTPLMRHSAEETQPVAAEEVGRIDNVLVVPQSDPLLWCPVEIQAVYFSGDRMDLDFESIRAHTSANVPFPKGRRRPDYRSSGPKRLMPQLMVKVPTLRRWGKKMAVVVDEDFFAELGRMEQVTDVSNCDVAWFVVKFTEMHSEFRLLPKEVFLTTLESSQAGLVAARPVRKEEFEARIRTKL